MWTALPLPLVILCAAFFLWLVAALLRLCHLPPLTASGASVDRPPRGIVAALLLTIGVAALVYAIEEHYLFSAYGVAVVLGIGLRLLLPSAPVDNVRDSPSLLIITVGLGIAALFLQLSASGTYPPGLAEDEAKKAMDCLEVLQGRALLTDIGSLFHPNLPCIPMLPFLAWLGPSVLAVHIYPMIAAALSVVTFYLLALRLLPADVALASSALFAVAPMLLLFGHVLQGTQITLLELLFVAFSVDAARRLSWKSSLFAGSALGLLLYDYLAARVLVLFAALVFAFFQLHEWRDLRRRAAVGGLLVIVALVMIVPLARFPIGWMFLTNPMQYRMADTKVTNLSWVVPMLRAALSTFHAGVAFHSSLSHTQIGVLPMVVAVLFLLGVGLAIAQCRHVVGFLILALFVLGMVPDLLSASPNLHRAIVALPAIYLLIGLALTTALAVLPRGSQRSLWRGGTLTIVVLAGGIPSLLFYYGEAWSRFEDFSGFGGLSMQFVREVFRQAPHALTQVTNIPVELDFLGYDLLRSGRVRPFRYANWLPENGSTEGLSIVIETAYAPLLWPLQDLIPGAQVRAIVGPADGARGGSLLAHPAALPHVIDDQRDRLCGTLMFWEPRRAIQILGGALEIDGQSVQTSETSGTWYAAGLHRACATRRVDMRMLIPGNVERDLNLDARNLYAIETHGWVHRTVCQKNKALVHDLVIEPVLYHVSESWPARGCETASHVWSTLVRPQAQPLILRFGPSAKIVSLTVNGETASSESRGDMISLTIPAGDHPTRLVLTARLQFPEMLSMGVDTISGEARVLPKVDLFDPPPEDMSVAAADVDW